MRKIIFTIIIYLLIMFFSYLYCYPQSEELLFNVIIGSIVGTAMSFIVLFFVKTPKSIGFSSQFIGVKIINATAPFMIGIVFAIITIICIIKMIVQKDFEGMATVLPCFGFEYNCIKAWKIYKEQDEKY